MIIKKQLRQRSLNRQNFGYIERAMTCGVRIENHGMSKNFRNNVDVYKQTLKQYKK